MGEMSKEEKMRATRDTVGLVFVILALGIFIYTMIFETVLELVPTLILANCFLTCGGFAVFHY